MSDFDRLIKFIPSLESGELGKWTVDEGDPALVELRPPTVEYWDVVYRFSEAVWDLAESDSRDLANDPEAAEIVNKLKRIIDMEESFPGILLGALENGTVVDLLKKLRSIGADIDSANGSK